MGADLERQRRRELQILRDAEADQGTQRLRDRVLGAASDERRIE